MKKPLTSILLSALLFCIIIPIYSFAQNVTNESGKIYHSKVRKGMFIPHYDSLLLSGQYEKSIINNTIIVNDTSSKPFQISYGIYGIAIAYSLLGNIDSAYYYLDKYVNTSLDDKAIFVDKNLDTLKHYTNRWNALVKKIEQGYVENIGVIKDTNLAIRLFYLGIEDQKYRIILDVLEQYSEEDGEKDVASHYAMQDTCVKIIEQYGIPTISMVGKYASDQFFFILQHTESKTQNKYYKLVKKAWERGDFDSIDYAMFTDRALMSRNKKQIYGTQMIKKSDDKKYPNQFYLYPVKDFKNVNKRRKEMGFTETVEEWINRRPGAFIPKEYYK